MAEYTLAHVGINGANPEEARKAAELFCTLFGFTAKEGNSSIFAGSGIEVMKEPYKGTHGHIAMQTEDLEAAVEELKEKGFSFNMDTAAYREDGKLKNIYLAGEFGGFAIHILRK